jgi:hypothetical protein
MVSGPMEDRLDSSAVNILSVGLPLILIACFFMRLV